MRNLLLIISFKGTNYHGFQVQKNAITVSYIVQNVIEEIVGHEIEIKGCSRTDAGVHANMYGISFKTFSEIKCINLVRALNVKLPNDIVAMSCKDVNNDFHARYSAIKKEYIYKIWNAEYPSPFYSDITYYYKYYLDVDLLDNEAKDFLGKHNFKSFCNFNKSLNYDDMTRTIYDFDIVRNGHMVVFKVCGDGFLYNMVRIMIGTLIFISEGKIKKGAVSEIINKRDRNFAGKTIAAKGLYLNKIYY